nr:MAG TPA: hypothetical protein [Caudoviricetes sp.]
MIFFFNKGGTAEIKNHLPLLLIKGRNNNGYNK